MDDSQRPWWLVVLLGIGVIGLAIWQASRFKPPVRLGAMLLALIYVAFLAYSIGGDPRGLATWRSWSTNDYLFIGQAILSVIAAVVLIGRPNPRGQAVWFGFMSAVNAGICAAERSIGTASLLALLAIACITYLINEYRAGRRLRRVDLWPQTPTEKDEQTAGTIWLTGGTGLVVAVLLIGTLHYALRAESSRATPTRRLSALPSPSRIRTLLNIPATVERTGSVFDRTIGQRADVVVLLSVLAFVSLAAATAKRSISEPAKPSLSAGPEAGGPRDDRIAIDPAR